MWGKVLKYSTILGTTYLMVLYPSWMIFGVLIISNIVDYITGILNSVSHGNKIDMRIAFKGIVKKINRLFYVIVALSVDILVNYNFDTETTISPVSTAVITWLVINEMVSIVSNISNNESLDIPPAIADFLKKYFERTAK